MRRIPQLVTHLEPRLQNSQIIIDGRIILENPTESDLALDKISLWVRDNSGELISRVELQWNAAQIKSKASIEAPVELSLPLKILNQQTINISIKTAVTYKVLAIRIPIESEIAVFHLAPLRDSLTGPMEITMSTRLSSDIFGNAVVNYRFDIINPFSVDLELEGAQFVVHTQEKGTLARAVLPRTILTSKQPVAIAGQFKIKNILRDIFLDELARGHAIKARLSGRLRLPETGIVIPFKAEAIQEIDFSKWWRRR